MDEKKEQVLAENIEELTEQTKRQLSTWHTFRTGLIYGAGFVIGSTVLVALVASILLHIFGGTIVEDVVRWFAEERMR